MRNPYAAGFYSLLVALAVVMMGVFYTTFTDGRPESTDKAFGLINSASALIQALAAIVVAGLAYKGLTSWKQQIIHGKALGIIWDANVALRAVERAHHKLLAQWITARNRLSPDQVAHELKEGKFAVALEQLSFQCSLLDKVVSRDGWAWQNRCNDIQMRFTALALERGKARSSGQISVWLDEGRTDESVSAITADLEQSFQEMEQKLEQLERRYLN